MKLKNLIIDISFFLVTSSAFLLHIFSQERGIEQRIILLMGVGFVLLVIGKIIAKTSVAGDVWKILLSLLVFTYMGYSYFNFRLTSHDGLSLYLKNVFLLSEDFFISYAKIPPIPYLAELSLSAIYRFFGINMLNLIMGVFVIFALLTTHWLYKEMKLSNMVTGWGLFILATSPVVLSSVTYEFKVEHLVLLVSNLAFILYLRVLQKPTIGKAILMGLLCAVASLIKVTYIPVAIILLGSSAAYLWKNSKPTFLRYQAVSFLIPLAIWAGIFGASIPFVGYVGLFRDKSIPVISAKQSTVKTCAGEDMKISFGMKENTLSVWDRAKWAIHYLRITDPKAQAVTYFSLNDPGVNLILGVLLLPFALFLTRKREAGVKVLYVASAVFIVPWYFVVPNGIWYIIMFLPFISIALPLVIESLIKLRVVKYVSLVLTTGISLLYIMQMVIFGLIHTHPLSFTLDEAIEDGEYTAAGYKLLNTFINDNVSDGEYVMDTTTFPKRMFFTFVKLAPAI